MRAERQIDFFLLFTLFCMNLLRPVSFNLFCIRVSFDVHRDKTKPHGRVREWEGEPQLPPKLPSRLIAV